MLTTDDIRSKFVAFFVARQHLHVASSTLVPQNDSSLLFTGAGMNQFKDHFLGLKKLRPAGLPQRAVSVQKCVRAADIENVGRTASHHTFFEMLGNFSFGDYFKPEAIAWAAEFLTQELRLDTARLSVSVFSGNPALGIEPDAEALAHWQTVAPWLRDPNSKSSLCPGWRIFGSKSNFWPDPDPGACSCGPCGPCSEIFYDDRPAGLDLAPLASCEGLVEIWNLVFTGYNRRPDGNIEPLKAPNIDTGAGLERLARVVQGRASNFETDLLFPIVRSAAQRAGLEYGQNQEADRRLRRIADHARMAVFALAERLVPKNVGAQYVLRRILRRAILDCQQLGMAGGLSAIVPVVISQMRTWYPELEARGAAIAAGIETEERGFAKTLKKSLRHFETAVTEARDATLSGPAAFRLWETYGLPIEILRELAADRGLNVDLAGFEAEFRAARARSQQPAKPALWQERQP